MARNLKGYFAAMPDCKQYTVKIISDRNLNTFEEILLAGESPFVVTYDTSNTPFEPLRTSRASINVIADEKFFDVFSEDPQGTRVVLEDASGNTEWTGFLTSNLLNMPDGCGNETFTLEAQDCLMTLDNYKYQTVHEHKQIVNFKEILAQIGNRCTDINTIIVDGTIRDTDNNRINVGRLSISEQNFFSSDTDEPWTLKEVLQEMCKYIGLTAFQWQDTLFLFDMQAHTSATVSGDTSEAVSLYVEMYNKSEGFMRDNYSTTNQYMKVIPLKESLIMGPNSDVSLETIYNKVEVKDSFYEVSSLFIPDLYEDNLLKNKQGDFWKCNQITVGTWQLRYLGKKGKTAKEEKTENDHVYYMRKFDHENYESIYRNRETLSESALTPSITVTNVSVNQNTHPYGGASGYGYCDVTCRFTNYKSTSQTVYAVGQLTYTWFDPDINREVYWTGDDRQTVQLGKKGSSTSAKTITLHIVSYWDENDTKSPEASYTAWYWVGNSAGTLYNISQNNVDPVNYVGATIVDLATFDKPMSVMSYNYETESNINFDRYIMIHQCDKPDRQHPYMDWSVTAGGISINPLKDSEIESVFPAVMKLKSGYTNPMIVNDNAYLYIDATAIFERYDVEYINPDWTDENSKMGGILGLFSKVSSISTVAPCLIFKLKIGDKYWSTQSGWTTTDSCFVVNLGTDKTDTDDTDFTGWWNEDHPVLNNVSWTDWAGAKGYKIPLNSDLDFSEEIEFQIHLPSKLQVYNTSEFYNNNNSYCWVKDLKVGFTTKDSENYDNSDVVYRNIINSGSVNTLSDITMKITTYPGEGMHSYSNVGLDGELIDTVKKEGLGNEYNKFEQQKIKAYVNQYSTNTIKQNLTLTSDICPLDRIKDPTLSNRYFGILGSKIDYAGGKQDITLIETKPWSLD